MRIEDYDRIKFYKWFLPTVYLINWALMYIGPTYYPTLYQKYYILAVIYLASRTTFGFIWTFIGSLKAHKLMDKAKNISSAQAKTLTGHKATSIQYKKYQVEHIFIIPNYKQEDVVLCQTIQKICKHAEAKQRYSIFLAMEDHQIGAETKALRLIAKYQKQLKYIGYTTHKLRKFQQRGKAANVSWCVEHLQQDYISKQNINKNQIMLTIMDADSWVPQLYIQQVEKYLSMNFSEIDSFIFQPCQMFTRNQLQVPFIVRYYDVAHGLVHFSNLYTIFGTSFPLSNYSLSYALAEKIGFWDTCPQAIGQDFHTTIKAFWKTNGNITAVPIFTPFNQLSIHTGKGFWTDVNKRFWQAERHGRGSADAAYNIKNVIQKPVCWRTMLIAFQALQITCLPAFLPWCLSTVGFTRLFNNLNSNVNVQSQETKWMNSYDVGWLFNICSLMSALMYICYDSVCRRANKIYYTKAVVQKVQNWLEWFLRFLSYNLVFLICIFTITIPSVTLGVFRTVLGENVYETAEKKISDRNLQLPFIQ